MSIVLNALKKAEKEGHPSQETSAYPNEDLVLLKANYKKRMWLFFGINALILMGLFFSLKKNFFSSSPLPLNASPLPHRAPQTLQANLIQKKPEKILTPPPSYEETQHPKHSSSPKTNSPISSKNPLKIPNGPRIDIQGVMTGKANEKSFVLVQGGMFSVGESVLGATLTKITVKKITFSYQGQSYVIQLSK